MATHLIAHGHGAGDPGAIGNGTNERDFNRKVLHPHLKKWADKSKHTFVFYDITGNKDLYQDTAKGWGIYSMTAKQYASITEIHEDAASATATGGHAIINKSFKPDKEDLSLAQQIKKFVGWWGSVKNTQGISYRNNLLNLNVAAQRGINYRLLELGFITNKADMDNIKKHIDAYARGIIESITGETLAVAPVPTPKPPASTFDINKYHTTQFAMIKMVKDDWAYKDKSLKTKVGDKVKKGTVLTVVGLDYSGHYPRYKLKSGLYITTRKDTIEEYKKAVGAYPTRKVGDTVTVKKTATTYQTGQPISKFVKGSHYKIKQVKVVNQSNSKRAYLLDTINSWILEQDLQ